MATGKKILHFLGNFRMKLAFQLGISILVVNLVVLVGCFLFQYMKIDDILLQDDEADIVKRFEQSEYNIRSFCEQVDAVSRRLSMDDNLWHLSNQQDLKETDRLFYETQAIASMETMQYNYEYLENISYYGDDGLILRSVKGTENSNFRLEDPQRTDWFYSSDICYLMRESKQKMKWVGGYSAADLGIDLSENGKEHYLISAVRNIISGSGTLVISVDMKYFLDIFYANAEIGTENIYIVDENNRIVAAEDLACLGKIREFADIDMEDRAISRYTEEGSQGAVQVVVYELSDIGWKLVSETAVAEVTKESRYMRNIMLLSCLCSVVISFALSMWLVSRLLKPLKQLDSEMQKVGAGQLGGMLEDLPQNELGAVSRRFNQMSMDLKRMFKENQLIEQERRELEMKTLRDQINPHLIYNVLNTIKWRALFSNERNIAESVSLLADFLEPVFRNQNLMCTVEEELNYVKNYIAIMNLLRTGSYTLELDVPEIYYDHQILRFLLQPIVENAIHHGYQERMTGRIGISVRRIGEDMEICVTDDGSGIEAGTLLDIQRKLENCETGEKEGIGIVNVHQRIRNQYGEKYGVSIENAAVCGTVVTLRIKDS